MLEKSHGSLLRLARRKLRRTAGYVQTFLAGEPEASMRSDLAIGSTRKYRFRASNFTLAVENILPVW